MQPGFSFKITVQVLSCLWQHDANRSWQNDPYICHNVWSQHGRSKQKGECRDQSVGGVSVRYMREPLYWQKSTQVDLYQSVQVNGLQIFQFFSSLWIEACFSWRTLSSLLAKFMYSTLLLQLQGIYIYPPSTAFRKPPFILFWRVPCAVRFVSDEYTITGKNYKNHYWK